MDSEQNRQDAQDDRPLPVADRAEPSRDRASELLRQLMYDPKTRKIVADQETAQEQLEQLAHAMIFDPSSRQLLERGDQGVEELFTRLNLNPTARRTAIDILSNFNYDALQRLAAAFGFKDPDDIN